MLVEQVQIVKLELQLMPGVQMDMVYLQFLMIVIKKNVKFVMLNVKPVIKLLMPLLGMVQNVLLVMIQVLL